MRIAELLLVTVLAGVIEHVAWPIVDHGANRAAVAMGIESAARPAASGGGQVSGDTITGPGGQCLDVLGDDTGGDLAYVDLWNCQSAALDQHWTPAPDGSLGTLGRCLDIDGDGTAPGTKVELFDCNGVGGQVWERQSDGSLLNPQSGLCLDDPGGETANGTRLQISACDGTAAERFAISGGPALPGTISGPGGRCVDVLGNDTGGDLAYVDLWNCQVQALDQYWYHSVSGSLETLGRCLDIDGDGTAPGTKVELFDCNGVGGQVWERQSDGSLLNPQSGLCLDDPGDATANGTRLQISACDGSPAERFSLS